MALVIFDVIDIQFLGADSCWTYVAYGITLMLMIAISSCITK